MGLISTTAVSADQQKEADAAALARVAAGDQQAYRALVDRHLSAVYGLGVRMLGDESLAEDMAQEAFLRLWRQAGRWRPEAQVKTWLYRVAHNLCIDLLRRRPDTVEVDPEIAAHPAAGPASILARRQTVDRVEAAIAGLPERQRTALTLAHQMELGNMAAAEIMGISVEALESLLGRARRSLRQRLAPERQDLMGDLP